MRIYELKGEDGTIRAFEVDSALMSRAQACRLAASIPGAVVIRKSRLFRDQDEFCEFVVNGEHYVIEEPFGDNSRYWIGPNDRQGFASLGLVRSVFEDHKTWQTPLRILVVIAVAGLCVFAYQRLTTFISQDRCLDSGGRWNQVDRTCSHPQN